MKADVIVGIQWGDEGKEGCQLLHRISFYYFPHAG